MITEEAVEAAVHHYVETDDPAALAKGEVKSCEIKCKRVRARVYLGSEGTVEERKARAEVDDDTVLADKEYVLAIISNERYRAGRESAGLTIEVWRSQGANRRQGNI